jgi:hypothetical protein
MLAPEDALVQKLQKEPHLLAAGDVNLFQLAQRATKSLYDRGMYCREKTCSQD